MDRISLVRRFLPALAGVAWAGAVMAQSAGPAAPGLPGPGAAPGGGSGSGTVSSVGAASPNGTLSIGGTNPVTTTGTINADIDLTHANAWTGAQTFAAVKGGTNVQSGSTYTMVAGDCGKTIVSTNAGAVTMTIPASIVPASGTACIINVLATQAAKVSVNGSAVSAATLISGHSYTGTSGSAGAMISLTLTTISAATDAFLTGDGS